LVAASDPFKAPAPLEGPSLYDPARGRLFPLSWGDIARSRATASAAGNNRREQRRFPLALKLTYTLKSGEHGSGELCNMGSSGLLFQCRHRFVKGVLIKVSVEWPYLLDGSCPLRLSVQGRVLRSGDSGTAVVIMKHEFRTARRSVPAEPIPSTPGLSEAGVHSKRGTVDA
jgi:hypothetical protein